VDVSIDAGGKEGKDPGGPFLPTEGVLPAIPDLFVVHQLRSRLPNPLKWT